jgi:hypothetical protein
MTEIMVDDFATRFQHQSDEKTMTNDIETSVHEHRGNKGMKNNSAFGGIYGLAVVGAAVYFIQHSATFWEGVIGLLKALVWPAMLMYKLLEFLKM